jgi:hypothetical protein
MEIATVRESLPELFGIRRIRNDGWLSIIATV